MAEHPDGLTSELLDLMQEEGLCAQEDLDKSGMTLENRIITSSLNMIKGKHKDLVERVFLFFAVFPEDVPIPVLPYQFGWYLR